MEEAVAVTRASTLSVLLWWFQRSLHTIVFALHLLQSVPLDTRSLIYLQGHQTEPDKVIFLYSESASLSFSWFQDKFHGSVRRIGHTHTFVCVCVYIYIYVCVYIHIVCVSIYIYMHTVSKPVLFIGCSTSAHCKSVETPNLKCWWKQICFIPCTKRKINEANIVSIATLGWRKWQAPHISLQSWGKKWDGRTKTSNFKFLWEENCSSI